MEFRSSRRFLFNFSLSLVFRISWIVDVSHTNVGSDSNDVSCIRKDLLLFFTRVISSYHIQRSKYLAWVKRLRDDDRHDLLTSVWTKIIDYNHHHWSVLVIQIFTSSIYLTEDSWYTTSCHRNYRWGSYSNLQIVWKRYQKKWHSVSTMIMI